MTVLEVCPGISCQILTLGFYRDARGSLVRPLSGLALR
jgi:hypothetical protein